MDLRQLWTLYAHEVRSALRERSIVVMSILIPLVMYPAFLWAGFAGFSFVEGQADRLHAQVALQGLPEVHGALADSLRAQSRLSVVEWESGSKEAKREVARGRLDLYVSFREADGGSSALDGNFQVLIAHNEARETSRRARAQVEEAVAAYRDRWVDGVRARLGVPDVVWSDLAVLREDRTTPEQGTRFVLALLVPFLTLITVALAAFYPAIDATAGERERSTWETLMSVAAPRGTVAAAKYLYVATFGALGGLLNLGALVLSLRWIVGPMANGGELGEGGLPLSALPMIGIGVALLGLFVAAGMLAFAVFARTFKEGQSMITPFYIVIILPAVFFQSPDIELTPSLALVPVANVVLLLREAILGSVPVFEGSLTLASMGLTVALSILLAQWVMRNEEVLLGATGGGLGGFLKRGLTDHGRAK